MAINALKGLLGGKGRFGRESASWRRRRRLYKGANPGSSPPFGVSGQACHKRFKISEGKGLAYYGVNVLAGKPAVYFNLVNGRYDHDPRLGVHAAKILQDFYAGFPGQDKVQKDHIWF